MFQFVPKYLWKSKCPQPEILTQWHSSVPKPTCLLNTGWHWMVKSMILLGWFLDYDSLQILIRFDDLYNSRTNQIIKQGFWWHGMTGSSTCKPPHPSLSLGASSRALGTSEWLQLFFFRSWTGYKSKAWLIAGWWMFIPQNIGNKQVIWLVVYLPLWKIWKSVGAMKFPIYGKS